jgi:hypothetical protein
MQTEFSDMALPPRFYEMSLSLPGFVPDAEDRADYIRVATNFLQKRMEDAGEELVEAGSYLIEHLEPDNLPETTAAAYAAAMVQMVEADHRPLGRSVLDRAVTGIMLYAEENGIGIGRAHAEGMAKAALLRGISAKVEG